MNGQVLSLALPVGADLIRDDTHARKGIGVDFYCVISIKKSTPTPFLCASA